MADPYRDETEALKRRVETLEGELDAAKKQIAELRGDVEGAPTLVRLFVGSPEMIEHTVVLDREIGPEDHAAIEVVDQTLQLPGHTVTAGKTMIWSSSQSPQQQRRIQVSARAASGKTVLVVRERLSHVAGALFGGIVGGAGGGGIALMAAVSLALFQQHWVIIPLSVLWVSLVYAIVRTSFRHLYQRRNLEARSLLENLEVALTPEKKRIAVPTTEPAAESESRAVAEAEAESASEAETEPELRRL